MNRLASAVQGNVRTTLTILWANEDNTPLDLTDATLYGTIKPLTGETERAITGALTTTVPGIGAFTWEQSAQDVATAGTYEVQFEAEFPTGMTPAKSRQSTWTVLPSN